VQLADGKARRADRLYNDGVILMPEVELGTAPLTKGPHILQVKIVGTNEKAVKNYMFGLDYLKLEAKAP
jgi:hypothetical protein